MDSTANTPPKLNSGVFKYDVDGKTLYGDPFEMEFTLREALPGVDVDAKLELLDDQKTTYFTTLKIFKDLSPGIYAMFGLPKFNPNDGTGWTLEQAIELWTDFLDWRSNVKKNTDLPPISPQPTDSTLQAPATSGTGQSTGNSDTGSGSTVESPTQESVQPSGME